jgi:hypothetical protein
VIVHPDFLDHWKTKQLVTLTGLSTAPLHILRLWAFCQHQRGCVFEGMTALELAQACHWDATDPADWEAVLQRCKFVRRDQGALIVHDWEKVNKRIIAAWENGAKSTKNQHGPSASHRPENSPIGALSASTAPSVAHRPKKSPMGGPSRVRARSFLRKEEKAGPPIGLNNERRPIRFQKSSACATDSKDSDASEQASPIGLQPLKPLAPLKTTDPAPNQTFDPARVSGEIKKLVQSLRSR